MRRRSRLRRARRASAAAARRAPRLAPRCPGPARPASARRGWRDLDAQAAQVLAPGLRDHAALGCPIEEPEAEQERLDHVLDRLDLLGQHGRERVHAHRARRRTLVTIATRSRRSEESSPSSSTSSAAIASRTAGMSTTPDPVHLRVVAHPLQQPVHDRAASPGPAARSHAPRRSDRDLEDAARTAARSPSARPRRRSRGGTSRRTDRAAGRRCGRRASWRRRP